MEFRDSFPDRLSTYLRQVIQDKGVLYIWSDSWRQILQNNGDAIPDTLRISMVNICEKIEMTLYPYWTFFWSSAPELELRKKYEDLGKEVLSTKGTSDWKNVEENLQRIFHEFKYVSIRVNTLDGSVCDFNDISRSCSVEEFRNKISAKIGIPADEFMLVHNEEELLNLYRIKNKSTLSILPRRGNGLIESVKHIFKQACDVATNLVDWFPSIFRDTTRKLTEKDLSKIAQGIGKGWKLLGYELGMTRVQMDHISENERSMVMRILEMLRQWREENQFEATVGRLHEAMKNCSKVTIDWILIGRVFAGI